MRRLLFAAGLAMAMAAGPVLLSAQAQPQTSGSAASDRLDLDLYWEYETVSDPQLSPNGAQVIYTRQWIDKVNDKRESSLWIMNADGTRNRFLTRGSNARWSPSGDRIVYTAQGEPKGTQVFVRYMDAEGAVSQVTRVEKTPTAVTWAPDGKSIAFTMLVEQKNTWSIKMPKAPEGAKWVETPRIVERLDYRQDGVGFDDDGYRHLFVVPATGGTPRQLTTGDWHHNGVEWTPDSTRILFTSLRMP
jgi:dipeptidyl aminopeptidase/acylaminoacyl peptidase